MSVLAIQSFISTIGSITFMLPFCLVIALILFLLRERKDALLVLIVSSASMITTYSLKYAFKIPRPSDMLVVGDVYRFPSGHATFASVVMCLTIYLASQYIRRPTLQYLVYILGIVWYVLISYSRLYLHAHLLVDVLVGGLIGIVVTWLAVRYVK